MARNLFSVPIFFIVFRETLEAAIIVSVLCGLVEQIVYEDPALVDTHLAALRAPTTPRPPSEKAASEEDKPASSSASTSDDAAAQPELPHGSDGVASENQDIIAKRLVRKMRIQIFLGSGLGLFLAISIGAAFIAVWFTQAADLWAKTENLWEGIFELIAAVIIFVMGVTMLKMDRAKAKWRIKLQRAFSGQHVDGRTRAGKWVLFLLPLITVLREGMEAVIFVGGVSLGQPAVSIPIAAIVGLACGLVVGFLIYAFASRTTLTVFMIVMTNFILLIGAGLFSRAVWSFNAQHFDNIVGADVDDTGGDGPGSFDVHGSVWHINCCNPENDLDSDGWTIFNAIFGWTNSATVGSVLAYVLYWVCVIIVLVFLKFKEGRTTLFGRESAAGVRRRERHEMLERQEREREEREAQREKEEIVDAPAPVSQL
ncbi:iron permease FTR1 [Wolfiporia cocos MD-104 SS10]|uniref:Iron permease FTR1 n=1 Tax=Wolfiporia cocos (strain MD-104) TaxID=742152 RepID=A0A2H3K0J9_WOLCO|nr:iron permease FTR1 [Wolfiporia cocos MD-104 SS10]